MGKKSAAAASTVEAAGEDHREMKDKEGHNLLGKPKFKKLENGRFKCVETGHEVPNAQEKAAYVETKHCRIGLIDAALANNKPPLNLFRQDPASRSNLLCQLTGDTVNKSEEHIWKHINGKRFLHMLEKKEAEKETGGEAIEGEEQTPKSNPKEDNVKEKKNKKDKKDKKKKEKDNNAGEPNGEMMYSSDMGCDSENYDFWVPPDGERWDMDDGGDRWGSGSDSESDAELETNDDVANGTVLAMTDAYDTAASGPTVADGHNKKSELEKKKKKRKRLEEEAAKTSQRGICYLSWAPRKMDPQTLRHILSQYAEVLRIYLRPENPEVQVRRKRDGGFRGKMFAEGWVEFAKKGIAKSVASMLNGQAIGGRKRSPFYYDLWNIKYLSKFKWGDLTEDIVLKKATREQKLKLEISAARKEKDFYLSKVDQSRALSSIEERLKKKQRVQEESGALQQEVQVAKVVRRFPQTKPVENVVKNRPKLSKDILAGVFGGGSS